MIRIFIGTDERSEQTDRVLEYSIREHTDAEVEVHWMRARRDDGWNRGRPAPKWRPKSGGGWGTAFSIFRFTIPERCGFEGRAIYMDSDMLVLGDVRELWELPLPKPWVSINERRTCVSVMDCSQLEGVFPSMEEMKQAGQGTAHYRRMLVQKGLLSPTLPKAWNCMDDVPSGCKLLHFTDMTTQPWRPWPEFINYRQHGNAAVRKLWGEYEDRSRNADRREPADVAAHHQVGGPPDAPA
jgi:hypothetical protein